LARFHGYRRRGTIGFDSLYGDNGDDVLSGGVDDFHIILTGVTSMSAADFLR